MDIKKIYNQLTNIDIEEQKKLWDDRGKGYYGEFLVFCKLHEQIQGTCKILMNLNIPIENDKTTEIDLLMIHESGIYVFEIKYYKGTIYGKDSDNIWTQYFRTTKNNTFKNPILQNEYHIKAINKIFPDIPIKSVIVFTNDECNIKVTNSNSEVTICTLHNIFQKLEKIINSQSNLYTMEEIESMFETLAQYSEMKEQILFDGKEASFLSWMQPTISKLEQKKNELEIEKNNWINKSKKLKDTKILIFITCIVVIIICIILTAFVNIGMKKTYNYEIMEIKQNYDKKLNKFKQNFMHVNEIGDKYIDTINEYIDISNVYMVESSNNSISFTARITISSEVYGIAFREDSNYIVMTNDGKVYEYNVFGAHLKYNRNNNILGKGIKSYGDLAKIQFYEISKEDISYIKINNIELFKLDSYKTIKNDFELELFKK